MIFGTKRTMLSINNRPYRSRWVRIEKPNFAELDKSGRLVLAHSVQGKTKIYIKHYDGIIETIDNAIVSMSRRKSGRLLIEVEGPRYD